MPDIQDIRDRLPRQWRLSDLRKLLGDQKAQAASYVEDWKESGAIENVPGKSFVYRFTSDAPARSGRLPLAAIWHRLQAFWQQRPSKPAKAGVMLAVLAVLVLGLVGFTASLFPHEAAPPETTTPTGPHTTRPVVAWYAPNGEVFDAIGAEVTYRPVARYGETWVQAEFEQQGMFWVRASDIPEVDLAALSDMQPPVSGYTVHVVGPGEHLQQIAAQSGSDAALIRSYNNVENPPVGRPLIVPRLDEHPTTPEVSALPVRRGSAEHPQVALIVDVESGDAAIVQMLDILRERNVKATFFVLGSWAKSHPDIVRRMVADGHELASHSNSHPDFRLLNNEQIAHELAETEHQVSQVSGATTRPYVRLPYGAYDDRVLTRVVEQGYLPIHWSIDSRDAVGTPRSVTEMVQNITAVRPPDEMHGDIILTHCCNRTSIVEALPTVLDRLAELDLEPRTLSEVLGS